MIVPSYDEHSWHAVAQITTRRGIFAAFGLHPWIANTPIDIDKLLRFCTDNNAVAIGEIGLDFKRLQVSKDTQIKAFKAQLTAAAQLNLPVLLHCLGAYSEMINIISKFKGTIRGVIHGFSRGPQLAHQFIDTGLHIAFGGAVTRLTATRVRQSAKSIPLNHMLLETDAPFIGLDDTHPKQTEPMHVLNIAKSIANLRSTSINKIAETTTQNAKHLFLLT